ncbi:MAG: tryptophan synthase subunit alpha [Bermanella sp.]
MNRIDRCFKALKTTGKKALIPYITGGDPRPGLTVELMHCLVESGADIIEIGVPFSDPMADGPVIQLACERALAHNTSLRDVLNMVKTFRQTDANTAVALMGYLNPIEVMGYAPFAALASESGVDAVLVVDMPPEESADLSAALKSLGMQSIFLMAPTTPDKRADLICGQGEGYLYYVSVKGVTGSAALDVADVKANLDRIRSKTDLPLAVGFGIKDGATAAAVAKVADAVIVGSALVNCVARNVNDDALIKSELSGIMRQMRAAMDAAV